jgi:hypothetical protein
MTCVKSARILAVFLHGRKRGVAGESSGMTPRYAQILRDARRRAPADATLLAALLAVVLAPLPALLLAAPAAPSAVLPTLAAAAPLFALPPFLLGGGFGTLLHLTVTARERTAAIEAGSRTAVSLPSLIASSLMMAAVFGSIGCTVAVALSRAA